MLIIIEGADKTGKTTLAKAIAKRFGYEYYHSGPPKGRPADEYIDFLLNLKRPTVCDRFHLGELVYGPMFRGRVGINSLEFLTIERMLRVKQAILIHAVTDIKLANKRLKVSTQKELVDNSQNIVAATLFEDVVKRSNVLPILRYEGANKQQLTEALDVIEKLLEDQIDQEFPFTGIGTVAGPKVVIVGEQVNHNITWRGLPFDKGLSSEFLAEVIKNARIKESRVYICNADKLTYEEIARLQDVNVRFISLGKKADKKLTEFVVSHTALPHPQWVKRFRYSERYIYAEDMRLACL